MGGKSDTSGTPAKTVVVLGGGLAGLSAGRSLLERGYRVTLVEKRPFLGGRAFSFRDPQVGSEVDNGQHLFMGCFTYYIDFLRAVAALDKTFLQDTLRVEVVLNGRRGILSSTPALGPLHLLPSFLRYPHLSLKDKLLVGYGLIRAKLTDRAKHRNLLDGQTFYEWLKRNHQTERSIDNLWNVIILPTLNDNIRDVSADMGLMIFQEGLLKKPKDATLGYSKVGLTSLAGEPAGRFLEERGAQLLMGTTAKSVSVEDSRVKAIELSNGRTLQADAYVCALPFDVLLEVLPRDLADGPYFSRACMLKSSPIVGIHLWYDRTIMEQDMVGFLESPVQWVFNKTLIQGSDGLRGQHVCISVSGAWEYVDRPKDELRELFSGEMERLFPKARGARIERFLVVKQPQATFRSVPRVAQLRPTQTTPLANLFLAGDWTDTGWPSTMEAAVRSGVLATEALHSRI